MEKAKRKITKRSNKKTEADKPEKSGKRVFLLFDGNVTAEAIIAAIKEHQKNQS